MSSGSLVTLLGAVEKNKKPHPDVLLLASGDDLVMKTELQERDKNGTVCPQNLKPGGGIVLVDVEPKTQSVQPPWRQVVSLGSTPPPRGTPRKAPWGRDISAGISWNADTSRYKPICIGRSPI